MGKFIYFNDTKRNVGIHTATETHGTVCDMSDIPPMTMREFELPEGSYPWVKMWDYGEGHNLVILVSPTMDNASKGNAPEHIGKYPVTFSFTKPESGMKLYQYFYRLLLEEQAFDDDIHIKTTLHMLINQIKGHLNDAGFH